MTIGGEESSDVSGGIVVRAAAAGDVTAICGFGAAHIPSHYAPLIGQDAAHAQVTRWWNPERISKAVDAGHVVVAEAGDEVVGVAECGEWEGVPVIWKLYVHPDQRGRGLGPRLIRAVIAQLPERADRVQVEVFTANHRAQQFYERQGFGYVRTEPDPAQPALAIVWRELDLERYRGTCGPDEETV